MRKTKINRLLTLLLSVVMVVTIFPLTAYSALPWVLSIAEQPTSVTVEPGSTVSFSVTVAGGISPYTYNWKDAQSSYYLTDGGSHSGTTTDTLTVSNIVSAMSGNKYICEISDSQGREVSSNVCTLTVGTAPLSVVKQPKEAAAGSDETATFSVSVSGGKGPYSYSWYIESLSNYAANGTYYSGVKTKTLTVNNVGGALTGREYSCIITDANGTSVKSNIVKLYDRPTIVYASPNVVVKEGESVTFSVTSSGGKFPHSYEWSGYDPDNHFYLSNNSNYSGIKTKTLTISNVDKSMNGYQYYCHIYDALNTQTASKRTTLNVVNNLDIINVDAPVAGSKAYFDYTLPLDAQYRRASVPSGWLEFSAEQSRIITDEELMDAFFGGDFEYYPSGTNFNFDPNKFYTFAAHLDIKSDCEFVRYYNPTTTVNTNTAKVDTYNILNEDADILVLSYFGKPNAPIDEVNLTMQPKVGQTLWGFKSELQEQIKDEPYTIDFIEVGNSTNDDYTFTAGSQPLIYMRLKPKTGYGFDSALKNTDDLVFVNGVFTYNWTDLDNTIGIQPKVPVVNAGTGTTVSGTFKSYGEPTDETTIALYKRYETAPSHKTTVIGNSGNYSINFVSAGTYNVVVYKNNHIDNKYTITVGGSLTTANVEICPQGDINCDGYTDVLDVTIVERVANGHIHISELPSYSLKLADSDSNSTIDAADFSAAVNFALAR